jgi:hypothetical protein
MSLGGGDITKRMEKGKCVRKKTPQDASRKKLRRNPYLKST